MDVLKRFFSDNLEIFIFIGVLALIYNFGYTKSDVFEDDEKIMEMYERENPK